MRKVLLTLCTAALFLTGCNLGNNNTGNADAEARIDSLQKIVDQKNNEIDDIMATVNEIEEGLRLIAEAENELTIIRDGEGVGKSDRIKANLKSISEKMARNHELIAKLEKQLRESSIQGEQLKMTISNLTNQIATKETELQQLRAQLQSKDIQIAELDQTVTNLNTNVTKLTEESEQKSRTIEENNQTISEKTKTIAENNQTIASQDKQLNTAWYVFGTKKELKDQHIIENDRVLQANFNKNYFTKVDIRVDKEIKLYSKSASLLTNHPASSYTLRQDANKQYVLRITNPESFWSTSKYLVVLVR